MDFRKLPSGAVTLRDVRVPGCLLGDKAAFVKRDIHLRDGQISDTPGEAVDMGGAIVLPCFVDMHTHLDKGHIWPRAANPDGTFMGALTTVRADSSANWSAEDVRRRMDFSLRCAFAHGTRAIRTHIDSIAPQDEISWPVFREMREEWAGRIDLQGACLIACDRMEPEGRFRETADRVADAGGVLGMVTYPVPDLRARVEGFLRLAMERGLEADFHVDETLDPESQTLRVVAETARDLSFDKPITVGHLCSLSAQETGVAMDTIDLVAEVGLNVVSLPMCNLYLQNRHNHRTPRKRGITLVHEMKVRGINVSFASDNTRDPFYAYGDMDMIEVMREATRIGHLDHTGDDWVNAFTANPAKACGFAAPSFAAGASADLVICKARSWGEFFARPQADRIVVRGGKQIDRTLPEYSELDDLVGVP
ncbi:cytosine deaminase [Algicella marina]|uniref:Cytosine deaminase n=1 Tax=Algicella marina TaxID=2683284 RepID=A0A6P1SWH7_9RHOB|nr:cytosine deaminase [Algicella marina]QHQ33875.1 cytosine deaminase [Algicella marina]